MSIIAAVVGSRTKWKWPGFLKNCKPWRHPTFDRFLVLPLGLSCVPYQLSVTGLESVQLCLGDLTFHNSTRNERKIKIQSEHWHKGYQLNVFVYLLLKIHQQPKQAKQTGQKEEMTDQCCRSRSKTLWQWPWKATVINSLPQKHLIFTSCVLNV